MPPEQLADKGSAGPPGAGRNGLPEESGRKPAGRRFPNLLPAALRWVGVGNGLSRGFRRELGQGLDLMQRLIGGTEEDIQRLCEQEQEFFLAAQAMTEQGSRVVELVSGRSVTEATRRLERLVEEAGARFRKLRSGFHQNLEILAAVQEEAAAADRPLAGFQQMVMSLNVLGISTRMESARMQGGVEGFQFLAEEVSRLSDNIKEQTEGMASQLGGLCARLDDVLGSMNGLADGLSGRVGDLLAVIGKSLEELRQWRSRSEVSAARMAANTRQVHADMAEVVSSMQFHDITRQRLEHVQENLSRLIQGGDQAPPADIYQLQTALLRHAEEELDQAAGNIRNSLRGIAGTVRQVAQEANLLIRGNDGQDVSFLERLEADLSGIMALADQIEQALAGLRDLVESVVATLEQVGSSLRSIDKIGYSIKFVALNAAVKSARLGDEGAALESLARAIQNLSTEARAATRNLAGLLGHLGESAGSLRQAMQVDSGSGDRTVRELESVLEVIHAGNQACNELLGELEHNGNDLAARMEEGAAGICFHLSIGQGISEVMGCLEKLTGPAGSRQMKPGAVGRSSQDAAHYTMASERRIHRAWAQGEVPGQEPPAAAPPKPAPAAARQPESPAAREEPDLGDNVELF